jgi:hypothetical protein
MKNGRLTRLQWFRVIGLVFSALAAASCATSARSSEEPASLMPISPKIGNYFPVMRAPASASAPLGRSFTLLAEDKFEYSVRASAQGFELDKRGGQFIAENGRPEILGTSPGGKGYVPFYRSLPTLLRIKPLTDYELSFDYRILDNDGEGFALDFYSEAAALRNDWVQEFDVTGPAGTEGRAVIWRTTKDYPDYQLLWNVRSKGSIAISDILLIESVSGEVAASDSGGEEVLSIGPNVYLEGGNPSSSVDSDGLRRLTIMGPARILTRPELIPLEPGRPAIMEFDYEILGRANTGYWRTGILSLIEEKDASRQVIEGPILDALNPAKGTFSGGIEAAEGYSAYTLCFSLEKNNIIKIGPVRILAQDPVLKNGDSNPADAFKTLPYPRLGNCQLGSPANIALDGSGTGLGSSPWMSAAELERRLALYDIVFGIESETTTIDPAFAKRLRALNPSIVLMPYTILYESRTKDYDRGFPTAMTEYLSGFDESWFLRTSGGELVTDSGVFSDIKKFNYSPYCPLDSTGRSALAYFKEEIPGIILRSGTWDGIFIDNLFSRTPRSFKSFNSQRSFDIDFNRNDQRDETLTWVHEMTSMAGAETMAEMRRNLGDAFIVIGNAGSLPEREMARFINGYLMEGFNEQMFPSSEYPRFIESGWCKSLAAYRDILDTCLDPAIVVLEGWGEIPARFGVMNSKRAPTSLDIRMQRMALGTALLDDGFYEFDMVHSSSAPVIFDEWCVDPQGNSVYGNQGKGWLGAALGPAVEIRKNERLSLKNPKDICLSPRRWSNYLVSSRAVSMERKSEAILEFDWIVEETLEDSPTIEIRGGREKSEQFVFWDLAEGTHGHERIHVTVEPGANASFNFGLPKKGRLSIKNLKLSTSDSILFRRDFEHGVVFVNPTLQDLSIDLRNSAAGIQRTGLRHIKGLLDPSTNDGGFIGDRLTLPAADAIVLIADTKLVDL